MRRPEGGRLDSSLDHHAFAPSPEVILNRVCTTHLCVAHLRDRRFSLGRPGRRASGSSQLLRSQGASGMGELTLPVTLEHGVPRLTQPGTRVREDPNPACLDLVNTVLDGAQKI